MFSPKEQYLTRNFSEDENIKEWKRNCEYNQKHNSGKTGTEKRKKKSKTVEKRLNCKQEMRKQDTLRQKSQCKKDLLSRTQLH